MGRNQVMATVSTDSEAAALGATTREKITFG
jgi:hypothetical protein